MEGSQNRFNRSVSPIMKILVLSAYGFKCRYCGCALSSDSTHIDHAIPLSRGGSTTIANLRAACSKCNLEKGDKTEDEYMKILSRRAAAFAILMAGM